MPTATRAAEPSPLPALFAARFTAIISQLIGFIALRLGRHPKLASLTPIFCNRLNRAARIIRAAMEKFAQGRRPRVETRRNRIRTTPRKTPYIPLPTAPGWLLRELRHEAALTRMHLENLLAEPGIAELLAQVPTLQRLLNPIRRALGIGHEPRAVKPKPPPPLPPQPQPDPPRPRARFVPFVRVL